MALLDKNNIFIKAIPGFPGYVEGCALFFRLLKALYGLKQASMLWHKLFNKVVTDLGYRSTHTDPCQYFYIDAEGRQSEFCLHIDDVLGASMSPTEGTRLARAFSKA
jgi:hypothetical protein